MNNAVMLVKDRPLLTKQAITTFLTNSKYEWSLTVVDDGSKWQTQQLLEGYAKHYPEKVKVIRHVHSTCNTAANRNLGVCWSEHYFGRGDYLYLSDNDAYFTPSWDMFLTSAIKDCGWGILGPYRHPYHQPNSQEVVEIGGRMMKVVETDAVQGLGWLLTWDTWDKYGTLTEHRGQGGGTNQSEDWEYCQRIRSSGGKVGSLEPSVVYNCGVTDSQGKPAVGVELMERVEGVVYV